MSSNSSNNSEAQRAAQAENARNQAVWANLHRSPEWTAGWPAERIAPTPGVTQPQPQPQQPEAQQTPPQLGTQADYGRLLTLIREGVATRGISDVQATRNESEVTVVLYLAAGGVEAYHFQPDIDTTPPGSK